MRRTAEGAANVDREWQRLAGEMNTSQSLLRLWHLSCGEFTLRGRDASTLLVLSNNHVIPIIHIILFMYCYYYYYYCDPDLLL